MTQLCPRKRVIVTKRPSGLSSCGRHLLSSFHRDSSRSLVVLQVHTAPSSATTRLCSRKAIVADPDLRSHDLRWAPELASKRNTFQASPDVGARAATSAPSALNVT